MEKQDQFWGPKALSNYYKLLKGERALEVMEYYWLLGNDVEFSYKGKG